MKHFLSLNDFTKDEILEILTLASQIKNERKNGILKPYFKNKALAMIFEKSSTRTRVSFEIGAYELGGTALFLSSRDIQLGRGEPIKDTARVISSMAGMIMARVYKHSDLLELAKFSKVPVINGLSDEFHPVQLMADLLTLQELGLKLDSLKVAYIGDANNMSNSWIMAASKLGFEFRICTPKGYETKAEILKIANENNKISHGKIEICQSPKEAVSGANVVTTDTWISMGQEDLKEQKLKDFAGFCVDENLMKFAEKNAIFLHCLPAYRGYEVSDEIFEAHADEIFLEAENRLHAQKGIIVWLEKML